MLHFPDVINQLKVCDKEHVPKTVYKLCNIILFIFTLIIHIRSYSVNNMPEISSGIVKYLTIYLCLKHEAVHKSKILF